MDSQTTNIPSTQYNSSSASTQIRQSDETIVVESFNNPARLQSKGECNEDEQCCCLDFNLKCCD
jgi:hypothetical protein